MNQGVFFLKMVQTSLVKFCQSVALVFQSKVVYPIAYEITVSSTWPILVDSKWLPLFLLRENKQGLSLNTCSFKARGVLELVILSWTFQYRVVPEVDTEKLVWPGGFYPFFPGDLGSSFDINLSYK